MDVSARLFRSTNHPLDSGTHRPVTVMCHDGYSSHDDVSQDSSYHCVYSCKHELHDNL
jgi:hypothetical protein